MVASGVCRVRGVERAPGDAVTNTSLSPREYDVLLLVASGRIAKEIAYIFGTSIRSVEKQMTQLRIKLGAKTIAHAVMIGFKKGVLTVDDFRKDIRANQLRSPTTLHEDARC